MREKKKNLLNPNDMVIEPLFTKKILEYPTLGKFKPLSIDSYDNTKDTIDHVQTFQSHMYYVGASDSIMCQTFPTTFRMIARDWYTTLNPNFIGSFQEFVQQFISYFASSQKPRKIIINLLVMQQGKDELLRSFMARINE